MRRLIDPYLLEWKESPHRKSLIIHGARQVGKTYAVQKLGKTFESFVTLNFEETPEAIPIFEGTISPSVILPKLEKILEKRIIPGKTLLFFDEVQNSPRAFISLRYFYEQLPTLHIIAAGSLLDFTIQKVGMPVGRVQSLYMFPMTFLEFLYALDYEVTIDSLFNNDTSNPIDDNLHQKNLNLLAEYLEIGGMPEAVLKWRDLRSPIVCRDVQNTIITTYRRDFEKYASIHETQYVSLLFNEAPRHAGKKFKFSNISGEFRKRELYPALNLLETAGIIHKVFSSAAQGIPLGGQINPDEFKVIFIDIALNQAVLGIDNTPWLYNPMEAYINKGDVVEAFVGQELLAYNKPSLHHDLYYWHRDAKSSSAEVDYVIQQGEHIIPIEVKSGAGSTLKSMHLFLESHEQSPYGIRFSTQNFSIYQKIHSMPLYAIFKLFKHLPKL